MKHNFITNHADNIDEKKVTKTQLKKLRRQIDQLTTLVSEITPHLDLLTGDVATRHLTSEESNMFEMIKGCENLTCCDVLTASELAQAYNDHYATHLSDHTVTLTPHKAGHVMNSIGAYAKRQINSINGSQRVWILRNINDHLGLTGKDVADYRDDALKSYHLRKMLNVETDSNVEQSFM